MRDYNISERREIESGKTEKIYLPKSNVIYLELEDNNNFIIRPSGTEPKIKLYCLLSGENEDAVNEIIKKIKKDIEEIVK